MRSRCKTPLLVLLAVFALSALAASPALASGKPFVETKPATALGETTATLKGIVNPNGAETKYHFEYGTTVLLGKTTPEASAGSGTSNVEESTAVTGLTVATTYYFRIVATNSNGTAKGSIEMFETFATAPQPEFSPAGTGELPIRFSVNTGKVSLSSGGNYTYQKGTATGEIINPHQVTNVVFTLKEGSTAACGGPTEYETLVTEPLKGRLGYVSKAKKEVGLLLEPKNGGKRIAKCLYVPGAPGELRGSVIGKINRINELRPTLGVSYSGGGGHQSPEKFEGEEVLHHLSESPGTEAEAAMVMGAGMEFHEFNRTGKNIGNHELEVKG